MAVIIGGAKIDTKIGVIRNFLDTADYILIGGALANTFLAAEGHDIGKSFHEHGRIAVAQDILMEAEKKHAVLLFPEDAIVADEASHYAKAIDLPLEDIEGNMKIFDIGSLTVRKFVSVLKKCKTIV